ncbi:MULTISPECIES: Holliday junction resolvase RuvX [unclassified Arthrobacter]|uniref:Holliday junction resolvase RuvX n=1 Tax=unclassified Arthrobacter TaxID=235627 RepID=UPI001490D8EB|nr:MULTISPECIES: Holliday junction resolvase RuvX [unclassified Arthrobacter]MBE0009838.1 Holliday junction resolvase RuvX [Arthrobacter sp. AET 35A]NOJ63662.1 Holliday junction resolvase RuvX [Arthrobacter sp. 147(2020)]
MSGHGTGGDYPRGVKIGVDVGMVRVGVASSDSDSLLATPVRTLKRDLKKKSDLFILIREIIERDAVQVFVGLPRNLSGTESASAEMARGYAQELANAIGRAGLTASVRLIDERLSTVSAHRSLRQAGLNTRNHRKVVDQVAAVEILQHAMDMQRSQMRDVGDLVDARRRNHPQGDPLTPTKEPVITENTRERNPEL